MEVRIPQHTDLRPDDELWIHTPRETMTWPEGRRVAHCRVAHIHHTWPRRDRFETIIELKDWQDLSSLDALEWLDGLSTETPIKRAKRLP